MLSNRQAGSFKGVDGNIQALYVWQGENNG